ncbi:MAG: c-type cytochrome [Bryobacterales bacterium]|nr:c-type cytochrome [Bryobacterales bacterium]
MPDIRHSPLLLAASVALCFASAKSDRGKYLVEEVARCQECHTPKLPDGSFDKTKWLKGAVLNIQPLEPIKGWHKTSPDLNPGSRLWERWKEEGMLNYFKTGLTPAGKKADAPMPTYTLAPEDAEAVVEYLKSLK